MTEPARPLPAVSASGVLPGVALICTVYNEAKSIAEFLESVLAMSALPEEFVIVDGGSTDGTNELIAGWIAGRSLPFALRHLIRPDCNRRVTVGAIARGRNVAVEATGCRIIAATDAGCRVDPDWLGLIVSPLISGEADVAGGWYLPEARTRMERCIGRTWVVPPEAVDGRNFLPSSRSIAFTRSAWAGVGGYPEYTYNAEDTIFDLSLRASGSRIIFVPDAIVRWRMIPTLGAFAALVFKYAYWEGRNRIMASNLLKSFTKVSVGALLLGLSAFNHPAWLAAFLAWMAVLAARHPARRSSGRGPIADLPCMMFVKWVADVSCLAGHVRGRLAPPARGRRPG